MPKTVIVIGGGICGLTSAYRLKQQGLEPIVVERANQVGGRAVTIWEDGFIVDQGASMLASSYKEALVLARELGLGPLMEPFAGSLGIFVDGKLHTIDIRNPVRSLLGASYLGLASKLSLARLVPPLLRYWNRLTFTDLSLVIEIDNQTAEDFCRKLVTEEAYERVLNALTRAMFGHDCSEISPTELLWMLKMFSSGSGIAFKGGMQDFPLALARTLDVRLSHQAQLVRETPNGVELIAKVGNETVTLTADYCAIATDGKDLQAVYGASLTSRQNEFLSALDYNPLSLVFFTYSKRPDCDAFIIQVPRSEDPDVGALAWYHLWGNSKAPADKGALIFLGSAEWQYRMENRPIDERIEDARSYVRKYFPEMIAFERSATVTPWPRATTIGRVGNYRRLNAFVADRNMRSRVQYGGDYMSESSVGTAVATGNDLARRLMAAAQAT